MTTNTRSPQAFVLDEELQAKKKSPKLKIQFDAELPEAEVTVVAQPISLTAHRGVRWGNLLLGAIASLIVLWAGLTITQLIEGFFLRSPFMGWVVFALAAVAAFAGVALILREIWGLARLRRIEKLQLLAAHAINKDDEASAQQAISELINLYKSQPQQAWNIKNYAAHANDILDPRDRVRLAERMLVDPLDEQAHAIIAKRAKRVTLLTTVTPAAALDIVFVGLQNMAMLRELATLYGGRPSTFATLRLARMVLTHLAIAGGLALSDNFIHLFVGKGLLGRLSARFGEGAVNGILTSRIGLAACDVCRPIPKEFNKREKLGSLLKELANFGQREKGQPES